MLHSTNFPYSYEPSLCNCPDQMFRNIVTEESIPTPSKIKIIVDGKSFEKIVTKQFAAMSTNDINVVMKPIDEKPPTNNMITQSTTNVDGKPFVTTKKEHFAGGFPAKSTMIVSSVCNHRNRTIHGHN